MPEETNLKDLQAEVQKKAQGLTTSNTITDDPAEAGKLELTAGEFYEDAKLDQGTQTSQDASNTVIQFTVKHEQNIDCGGDHIKLSDCKLNQSPYNAMNLDEFNKAEQLDEFTKAEELD